jgi:hypothetical protein
VPDPLKIKFTPLNLGPAEKPHNPPEETSVFYPDDRMQILIRNESGKRIYIEVVSSPLDGRAVRLPTPATLEPGKEYTILNREGKPFRISKDLGTDTWTLFASDSAFPPGVRLNRKDETVGERVVHPFYTFTADNKQIETAFNPDRMTKKTLEVETRDPARK